MNAVQTDDFIRSMPLDDAMRIAARIGEEIDAAHVEDNYAELEEGWIINGKVCTVSYTGGGFWGWDVWRRGHGTIARGANQEEAMENAAARLERFFSTTPRGPLTYDQAAAMKSDRLEAWTPGDVIGAWDD